MVHNSWNYDHWCPFKALFTGRCTNDKPGTDFEALGYVATAISVTRFCIWFFILLWKCFKIDKHFWERPTVSLWQMLQQLLPCFKVHSVWCSPVWWKTAFTVERAPAVAVADLPGTEPVKESKWPQKDHEAGLLEIQWPSTLHCYARCKEQGQGDVPMAALGAMMDFTP